MSSKDWKPWYEKVADFDTPAEKEEFMKGIAGKGSGTSISTSNLLLGLLAGYVGGKAAKSKDKK